MNQIFFKELRKISYEDDMRYKLLLRGVKQILEKKREEGLLKRMFRKKKHIEAKAWK
ncbi:MULTISPECIES: hypothetical protein [Paenibacillus]|uniref:Fur-regulated basic protein FbpA n=1 Tax=Paenibacillus radicis (ex Xue et al. 2023) TaxID=2972489 RepID=A0ABT1YFH6_9BACL|nr:hypothetical protein [Paenibacillus radicis (ex Xue et al. 2023)]MCR8631952.1 hypothetical protein [Paenibacillus radicis (ex Xue et al. 2023)]